MTTRQQTTINGHTQPLNHPVKGAIIEVEPLRSLAEVEAVRREARTPRNRLLFTMGVNTNLRASDLLRLRACDIDLFFGTLRLRETKTGKKRCIHLSQPVIEQLTPWLSQMAPDELIFRSQKPGAGGLRGSEPMSVSTLNNMVKKWCDYAGLGGNYGSHTLRKTWAYLQFKHFGTPLEIVSRELNHNSMATTYRYLGIMPADVKAAYGNYI